MYKNFFRLHHKPFSISPDPRFLFMSDGHREALAHLQYGIQTDNCFVLLTGEIGAGKTTICRCLLEQISDTTKVAYITNTMLSVSELLETVCDEFGVNYPTDTLSPKVYIDLIKHFLYDSYSRGHKPVLIIDEAQNLSTAQLELIRLLTNLETNERKLLMIILLGQPELREKLATPELKQFRQRITARYHLDPLSKREVIAYVKHRLAIAGKRKRVFCNSAFNEIYRFSNGIPRLINSICDRALLGAYTEGLTIVDKKTLVKAANEYLGKKPILGQFSSSALRFGFCSLLVIGCMYLFPPGLHNKEGNLSEVADPVSKSLEGLGAIDSYDNKEIPYTTAKKSETTKIDILQPPIIAANSPRLESQLSEINLITQDDKDNAVSLAMEHENVFYNNSLQEQEIIFDSLVWPDYQPIENSKTLAFQALFDHWGMYYDASEYPLACDQAKSIDMNCFFFQGNLGLLKKINRPAVLKMINENGVEYYGTLISLSEDRAVLDLAGEQQEVSIYDLEKFWFGSAILLWQMPPDYHGAAQPGTSEPWLWWLDQQLAALGGESQLDTNLNLSGALLEQTRKLQSSCGFIPDGIVGPQTIICLNTLTDDNVPILMMSQL